MAIVYVCAENKRQPLFDQMGSLSKSKYESIAVTCAQLAANELERNLVEALVDSNCLGDIALDFDDAFGDESDGEPKQEQIAAFKRDPVVAKPGAVKLRSLLEELPLDVCDQFPQPEWTNCIRHKKVSIRAISAAWKIPQNRIRMAIRNMEKAGIATELRKDDMITLTPLRIHARMLVVQHASLRRTACE